MKRRMIIYAVIFIVCFIPFGVVYHFTGRDVVFSLVITFGTISYHFVMRLVVGGLFQVCMKNQADVTRNWYQVRDWENRLYKKLKVKRWKGKMPAFDASLFDPSIHSWREIAEAMCQAELVHETIILLSFVPVIAGVWFGAFLVFIITSIVAACIDAAFVIMQRYNRSRIVKMKGTIK